MAIYQDPLPNHQQQQAQPQQPPQQQQNQTANINTIFTDEELSPKRWKPSPGPNWEREESPVEWLEPVPKDESMRNQVTLEEPATTHIAVNDACNPNATRLRPPQAANASSPAPRVRYAPPQSPTSPLRASSTPVLRPPTNPPSSPTPILKPIKSILQLSTIATPAEASTSLRASPSTQSTISDESACTMQPEAPRRCHANHKGWQAVKQDPAADVHTGAVSDEEATPMEEDEVLKERSTNKSVLERDLLTSLAAAKDTEVPKERAVKVGSRAIIIRKRTDSNFVRRNHLRLLREIREAT